MFYSNPSISHFNKLAGRLLTFLEDVLLMLENKFYSNPAISHLTQFIGRLPNICGRQPNFFLKTVLRSP